MSIIITGEDSVNSCRDCNSIKISRDPFWQDGTFYCYNCKVDNMEYEELILKPIKTLLPIQKKGLRIQYKKMGYKTNF